MSDKPKEFLVVGAVLMVRSSRLVCESYDIEGHCKGTNIEVSMRPATLDEVAEYWEQKRTVEV